LGRPATLRGRAINIERGSNIERDCDQGVIPNRGLSRRASKFVQNMTLYTSDNGIIMITDQRNGITTPV
jgi:hypothetical protein